MTRRAFVNLVGRAGGAGATYSTLSAMGLLPTPAYADPPQLKQGAGRGQRVIIIGAGIAGMVAAYELRRAGYECVILEARNRAGGRNTTIRGGDLVPEVNTVQRNVWDPAPGLYFNAGPARLPQHHRVMLGYCRELGVPLEIIVNDNREAFFHDDNAFDGRPQRGRAMQSDARGFVAELAAKGLARGALDRPLEDADRERLREFLRQFGDLDREYNYRGSNRGGYATPPGAGDQAGTIRPPSELAAFLRGDFWREALQFGEGYEQAATMLQPVGGMDRIAEAFSRALRGVITFDVEVRQIRKNDKGVRVIHRNIRTGRQVALEGQHLIVTCPLPVLRDIDAEFPAPIRAAIGAADYIPAVKVAFEAQRRFWEIENNIYGGITWTNRDITQVWYPSTLFNDRKGALIGAYIWTNDIGNRFAAMAPADRLEATLASLERIHPEARRELARGVSVAWSKVPYSLGAWQEWTDAARRDHYPALVAGDPPIYFAGEHVSHLPGWQEGAALSAHNVVRLITARASVPAQPSGVNRAPAASGPAQAPSSPAPSSPSSPSSPAQPAPAAPAQPAPVPPAGTTPPR